MNDGQGTVVGHQKISVDHTRHEDTLNRHSCPQPDPWNADKPVNEREESSAMNVANFPFGHDRKMK
jgi:hypothetical protein